MRVINNIASHVATATLTLALFGGIGIAAATSHSNDQQPPAPAPVPTLTEASDPQSDLNNSACAMAPSSSAKFQVFQDLNYGFGGANDRMRIGNTYQQWSNDPTPTYNSTVNVEGRGKSSTKITEIQACVATIRVTQIGTDPTYGYPLYDYALTDARWESLYKRQSGKRTVNVAMPVYNTTGDVNGSYSYTYAASMFFGARGSGSSSYTYVSMGYGGK